ncbi:hypothetical protein CHS0354_005568 [Potamilus streckersoni]|uniref:G-protein coupled receptors family 1 profile domain-containing protein n=1 Tax=Potamilus streckersoni TaxID=2493646 RepID=A0AAE0RNH1_9BIVA|nr:hypothetical protein CHS0354_005568 [Potamilus streckersoni]
MEEPDTIAVLVILSFLCVLGTIGNATVLYIYLTKKDKSTAGVFIMTLAGTDFLTCLVIVPYTEIVIYLQYRLLYDLPCKIYMFLITCNVPFSAFIMVAIAIDRYFCICHPFAHAINLKRAKCVVLLLICFASTLGLITAMMHSVYDLIPSKEQTTDLNVTSVSNNTFHSYENSFCNKSNVGCLNITLTMNAVISEDVTARSELNTVPPLTYSIAYIGECIPSGILIGETFREIYQKVYAGFYLMSFIAVFILYGIIYRAIHKHRVKKSKRKKSNLYPSQTDFTLVETQTTMTTHANGTEMVDLKPPPTPEQRERKRKASRLTLREKTLYANIRTAAILFVVTIVFLIAFLPAWLMATRIISFNMVVFYMHFVYNVANPFIYAFMNKSFRDDLLRLLKVQ